VRRHEKSPEELRDQRTRELTALRESGTAYQYVSRAAVNPGYEAWFRGVLPEAGITVLPGSGHFPHLAQPEAVVKILSGWE
jgi:pimeloyl-ACP methyl ester carboxylesterase